MAKYFHEKDIDLLETALELTPHLLPATLIAKELRQKIKYPIKSRDDFKTFFTKKKVFLEDKTLLTYEQVEKYLPPEFFPIETERDLLCRLLIAFQRGHLDHLLEKPKPGQVKDFPKNVQPTILPAPSLSAIHLAKLSGSK